MRSKENASVAPVSLMLKRLAKNPFSAFAGATRRLERRPNPITTKRPCTKTLGTGSQARKFAVSTEGSVKFVCKHSRRNKILDSSDFFDYCEVMAKGEYPGDLEQLVLTAVILLGREAYGMTIHEKVEELAEGCRAVSLGSAYTTLERLEQKGYVKSWFGEATPERGGRAKKYFEITASGESAAKKFFKVADNMVRGLREIGVVA